METSMKLAAIAVLIVLTAFFVASEFAIVKVRKSKLEARANEGHKRSKLALKVTNNLDYYLSACQLGITITALGLGWLGEPTLEVLLHPLLAGFSLPAGLSHTISFAIAFFVITFLHVVLGELAPKTLAIQKAEALTLMLSPALVVYSKVMYPLIWLLNGSANVLIRLLGFKSVSEADEVHSEEELRHILSESYEKGEINQSEYEYVERIFDFDERLAKEIMAPRTDMAVVDIDAPLQESIDYIRSEKFTRYPVVQGDKDHIIGFIHIKELFHYDLNNLDSLKPFIHPVGKVFENIPVHQLLVQMQKEKTQLMVLTDEYGGTSGIVTIEDIIEEIVGDIHDEFDEEEEDFVEAEDGTFILDGKVSISDVNHYFDITLENGDVDTISGWILKNIMDVREGVKLAYEAYNFEVVQMEDDQIRKVKVSA
ncbi:hemolysin family protein [Halobacillus litoralis]|uniref:hemolysin family protein n=1 Tax=Halobacillus litoralis TaxID=45668 RepID=UPI001CD4412A|nr:hemolysin family protein [Halobacillus litoralis]MCA0970463.1 hemolysin family protein [Halobacillus litoralis]